MEAPPAMVAGLNVGVLRNKSRRKTKLFGLECYDLGSKLLFVNLCHWWDESEDGLDEDTSLPIEDRPFFLVPAIKQVCESCGGSGVTTSHIECDGGGFTSSEWAEMCDGDPDFAEDYLSGVYDRPCPECDGQTVVSVPSLPEDHPTMRHLYECAKTYHEYRQQSAYEY